MFVVEVDRALMKEGEWNVARLEDGKPLDILDSPEYEYHGPFEDPEDAAEYGEQLMNNNVTGYFAVIKVKEPLSA